MMDLVLENNNLRFDNKHSLQTDGTAIGSHLGMNYDCTYLGNWEQELYSKVNIYHPIIGDMLIIFGEFGIMD
jgi:hypothetical protein